MSVLRWKLLPPVRIDRYGYYLCRLCKKACPSGERQWCSEECLRIYLTISDGNYVRAKLFERDRGVCALCGVDAARMDEALARLGEDLLHPLLMSIHPMIAATLRAEGWRNIKLRGKGCYADAIRFSSCWEADHIQSVAEGGGQCGLENFRTLCYVCHKKQSAEQARARAAARRAQRKNKSAENAVRDAGAALGSAGDLARLEQQADRQHQKRHADRCEEPDDEIPFG